MKRVDDTLLECRDGVWRNAGRADGENDLRCFGVKARVGVDVVGIVEFEDGFLERGTFVVEEDGVEKVCDKSFLWCGMCLDEPCAGAGNLLFGGQVGA